MLATPSAAAAKQIGTVLVALPWEWDAGQSKEQQQIGCRNV